MDEKNEAAAVASEEQIAQVVEEANAAPLAMAKPRLFVKTGVEVTSGVHVFFKKDTGEVVSVVSTDATIDVERMEKFLGHVELEFKFSKPMYQQLSKYRQRSSVLQTDGTTIVDGIKMRDFFLLFHLKGWNLTDDEGMALELKFDPNGALSNESAEKVYGLDPSIIDVIMTTLERKLLV